MENQTLLSSEKPRCSHVVSSSSCHVAEIRFADSLLQQYQYLSPVCSSLLKIADCNGDFFTRTFLIEHRCNCPLDPFFSLARLVPRTNPQRAIHFLRHAHHSLCTVVDSLHIQCVEYNLAQDAIQSSRGSHSQDTGTQEQRWNSLHFISGYQ